MVGTGTESKHVGTGAKLASKTVQFAGLGGLDVGHGGLDVGHGGLGAGERVGNGGKGALDIPKNDGMERRRRQSRRKVVEGGGFGMYSTADKGKGRKQVHFEHATGPPAPAEGQYLSMQSCFDGVEGKLLSLKHAYSCVDN